MEPNLDQLYASELRSVYGFLYRLGARDSELQDLAHDVFATAVRRWSSYDPSRPVRPWLLGIAFRVATENRRKLGREILEEAPEQSDPGATAEDLVRAREAKELVDEALQSLDEARRAVFVMYELEGLSAADISRAMGTPHGTTYSRLRIGREEFAGAVRRIQLRRGEA